MGNRRIELLQQVHLCVEIGFGVVLTGGVETGTCPSWQGRANAYPGVG